VPWSNAFLVMVKSAKAAERVMESLTVRLDDEYRIFGRLVIGNALGAKQQRNEYRH
jgi:hypothetical protein